MPAVKLIFRLELEKIFIPHAACCIVKRAFDYRDLDYLFLKICQGGKASPVLQT